MSEYGTDRNPECDTLLTFKVGGSYFCTAAIAVESIEEVHTVTSLPLTPEAVEGVFLYRDTVATSVNMARKLGLKASQSGESPYFIVTNIENEYVAFRVDEVRDLISTSDVTWDTLDTFVEEPFKRFALWEEQVYLYIDLPLFYTLPEWQTIEYLQPSLAHGRQGSLPDRLPSGGQLVGESRDDHVVVCPVNTEPAEVVIIKENLHSRFDPDAKREAKEDITGSIGRKRVKNGQKVKSKQSTHPSSEEKKSRTESSPGSTGSPGEKKLYQPSIPELRAAGKTSRIQGHILRDSKRKEPARFRSLIITTGILLGLLLSAYFISTSFSSRDGYTFRSPNTDPADMDVPEKSASRKYAETGMGSSVKRYQPGGEETRNNRMTKAGTSGSGAITGIAESREEFTNRENNTLPDNIHSARSRPDEIFRYDEEKSSLSVDRPQAPGQISDDGYRSQVNPGTERGIRRTDNVAEHAPDQNMPATYEDTMYTVKAGDTLWEIAHFYLGNPFRYPELAELSRIRDPDLIYPGDQVRIIR